jgi:hypothetical protein
VSNFAPENSKGTIQLSREFLEACLEERVSQEEPVVLDARQRKFLELVAEAATFSDIIEVPKELLEAFLAGHESLSSTNMGGLRGSQEDHPS